MLTVNCSVAFDQLGYVPFLITQALFYSKIVNGEDFAFPKEMILIVLFLAFPLISAQR